MTKNNRKPYGYWKERSNVKDGLERVTKSLGHFPSWIDLENEGEWGIIQGIRDYHGGSITRFREEMGHVPKHNTKPENYWPVWMNMKSELEAVITALGHFPTQPELVNLNRQDLHNAIFRHHNGLNAVRERMGYELERFSPGHWNLDTIKKELTIVAKKLGHFPIDRELREMGYGGMLSAIEDNYDGLNSLRRQMGYTLAQKPKKYWKDWNNAELEMTRIATEIGHIPTTTDLRNFEQDSLVTCLRLYHGGVTAARERIRQKLGIPTEKEQLESLLEGYVQGV